MTRSRRVLRVDGVLVRRVWIRVYVGVCVCVCPVQVSGWYSMRDCTTPPGRSLVQRPPCPLRARAGFQPEKQAKRHAQLCTPFCVGQQDVPKYYFSYLSVTGNAPGRGRGDRFFLLVQHFAKVALVFSFQRCQSHFSARKPCDSRCEKGRSAGPLHGAREAEMTVKSTVNN